MKYDHNCMILLCKDVFGNYKWIAEFVEVTRGLFGNVKHTILLGSVPVNYCPWCGRKLPTYGENKTPSST